MKSELAEFYALVDELDTAMMTTRQRDGHLRSRAMANQKPADGADLWFVTMEHSPEAGRPGLGPARQPVLLPRPQPRVGLGFGHRRGVAGARKRYESCTPATGRSGFPQDGDPRHGTPDDPRMVLIGVTVHAAEYLKVDAPRPLILFEV